MIAPLAWDEPPWRPRDPDSDAVAGPDRPTAPGDDERALAASDLPDWALPPGARQQRLAERRAWVP
ncbi:hypothetical protein ACFY2R_18725 [Micromonospora olivasterospora]|uniref:Uncharacterized protein n=1 Tax=Micromonospora olivasterospora TaxID=1880 RepID=A0A562I279_MICOL|nr:hypothetical protein [Micromonospora olivasterospora]TWH65139.1 hypothetical protein JD77_00074 [Micromonospora olivasterospora]